MIESYININFVLIEVRGHPAPDLAVSCFFLIFLFFLLCESLFRSLVSIHA